MRADELTALADELSADPAAAGDVPIVGVGPATPAPRVPLTRPPATLAQRLKSTFKG